MYLTHTGKGQINTPRGINKSYGAQYCNDYFGVHCVRALFLVVHGTVCAQYFFLRDFNPDERQKRVEILTLVRAPVDMDILS